MTDDGVPVHIIGAGPGGLATAAALHGHGISTVVLEKSPSVAASWRAHYDRLRLHTTRRWSSLPGLPIPRSYGRWVARGDFVSYLESYAEHHGIEVATGVEVDSIERGGERHEGDWVLHANGGRRLTTPVTVVATGYNHTAHLPSWPGREDYEGELLHASRYRNAKPYAGKDVLVAGVGNTGAEIAADLAEGGAARVRLAVRTVPHIVRRSTLGWPAQANGILCRRLPTRVVDSLAARMAKVAVPDLSAYGLPRPGTGLYTRARQGAIPIQDVGLIAAVRKGKIEPVAAVESFDGAKIQLADGTTVSPDVVIAATGYRPGLEDLVGGLGVLDARGRPLAHGARTHPDAPGLYFTGYTNPLSGMLRELSLDAGKIARGVAKAMS
jgi:cation diffusion facilitator CzcD-associated flavoprotein CzcO